MFTSAQIISIPVNLSIGYLLDNTPIWVAQSPGLVVSLLAFILIIFVKEDLRRLGIDEVKAEDILDPSTDLK
jgi:hypothetical protein